MENLQEKKTPYILQIKMEKEHQFQLKKYMQFTATVVYHTLQRLLSCWQSIISQFIISIEMAGMWEASIQRGSDFLEMLWCISPAII